MSGPASDFPDEAIRIELKRMVEQCRAASEAQLDAAVAEILCSEGGTPEQREEIAEKLTRSFNARSRHYEQFFAFIDRNA